jgi:CRISPR-associated protein Cmr3
MNKIYLVTLTPLSEYFFGGKKIFFKKNSNEINSSKKEEKYYFVKSEKFPQQSSLLGMIRKEMLIKNNLFKNSNDYSKEEKEAIVKIIGKESFCFKKEDQNFGKIKKISPIFIMDENLYIKTPLDFLPSKENSETGNNNEIFSLNKNKKFLVNYDKDNSKEFYLLEKYDDKKGLNNSYINLKTLSQKEENEIFKEKIKSYVNLLNSTNRVNKEEDNNYYMIQKYEMCKKLKFAFYLELETEESFDKYENIVYLGGENSYFKISFIEEKEESEIEELINKKLSKLEKYMGCNEHFSKIYLISSTFIDKDIYNENVEFAIAKTTNFKNFNSNNNSFNFENRELLSSGTVLYVKNQNIEKLEKELNSYENAKKIGFNYYYKGGEINEYN